MPIRIAAFAFVVLAFASISARGASDDPDVVFSVAPGDRFAFEIVYGRGGAVEGTPAPGLGIRYDLDVAIKTVNGDGVVATVTARNVDMALDGARVISPPEFDSLLVLATEGLSADVQLSPDGIVDKVLDWEPLRERLVARAIEKAGEDEALRHTVEGFLPGLSAVAAAEIFARPLAMSAPGRIVKLGNPGRREVNAKGVELPSFTTNAKGNWTFTLIDGRNGEKFPGGMAVEWLGVPNAGELRSILSTVLDQLRAVRPESEDAFAVIERDARMWQRFIASYDRDTGQLLYLTGEMELRAGPIQRRVMLKAVAKEP